MQAILIAMLAAAITVAPQTVDTAPAGQPADAPVYETISIIQSARIHRVEDVPILQEPDGYTLRFEGQVVRRTVELPRHERPLDARRVIARLTITPETTEVDGRRRPNDPWNRLGSVAVLLPPASQVGPPREVELLRFVTGYGGGGVFEEDVTTLAPLLSGPRTFLVFVSSYSELPGWRVSLELVYTREGLGYRRPKLVLPLFNEGHVTGSNGRRTGRLSATVTIDEGLSMPRLRIITTGHATDGAGENEFVTATHLLRIDGRVVARWRPWDEQGGTLRARNPWAGRQTIDEREIWASDLDRSGWHPGAAVPPVIIPAPELSPGEHRIELEIRGIRPPTGEDDGHGFWVVSGVVVADEPWSTPLGVTGEEE